MGNRASQMSIQWHSAEGRGRKISSLRQEGGIGERKMKWGAKNPDPFLQERKPDFTGAKFRCLHLHRRIHREELLKAMTGEKGKGTWV